MFSVAGLVAWAGFNLSHSSPALAHQVAKIALLPDTPPPPPPPEQPKIQPREMKMQFDRPKQVAPPEPQQLKMEGQAGEGPSPFTAGDVKNDYIGGDVGNGRYMPYIGHVAQTIQEALTRRKVKIANARILLWLNSDGAVQRIEVSGAGPDAERELRAAVTELGRGIDRPPQDMPMPMGLEITSH